MTKPSRKIMSAADDRAFAVLWEAGMPHKAIAEAFGLAGAGSVDSIRLRLGLAPKRRCARKKADPAEPEGQTTAPRAPTMPPHPFWTPVLDLAVMATAGSYPALAALARQTGKPMVAVRQRWHQLRAA